MGCKLSLDIRDVDQRSTGRLPVIPYHKDGSTSPPRISFKDVASSPIVQITKIQEEDIKEIQEEDTKEDIKEIQEEVIEEDYKPDAEVDIYSVL